jgi:electron transfer flavoprotein beta subunit
MMKILVPVKRVVDYNVKVRPTSDGLDVDLSTAKMAINPFCEIAVEEAIRMKESRDDCEIVVVSVGPAKASEQLRAALALGADRAILIETDERLEPLAIAKCLHKVFEQEAPDLVLLGKQAIDFDNNQTGQLLAGLCGIAQGTFCSRIVLAYNGTVEVTREVDDGLEVQRLSLPAVITTDLRLNEPRYATLPQIMKAKKKPITVTALADFLEPPKARTTLLGVMVPPPRKPGQMLASIDELIDKIKNSVEAMA